MMKRITQLVSLIALGAITTCPVHAQPVITELSYDLSVLSDAELASEWTVQGNILDRVGLTLTSAGDPLYFSKSDIAVNDGEAFLFETVFSAPPPLRGERGSRLIVQFLDTEAPQVPPPPYKQLRRVEVRFQDNGGGTRWISLVDGTDGSEKAALLFDWASTSPRTVVRVRRQQIGLDNWIFLEAGPSADSLASQQVRLVEFGADFGADSLFQFGNIVAGNYTSDWEVVRIVRSNEPDTALPLSLQATIDVKPGSDPNCFNINGHGVIPVAILGSDTFDVANIDPLTLSFGGLHVRVRGKKGPLCNIGYSDSDAYLDLVCHFEDDAMNWSTGVESASLTGTLLDGREFEGSDSICIVP